MTFKKTKLVLGIATAVFALSSAVVATEAAAKTVKKTYKKKKYKSYKTSVAPVRISDNSAVQAQIDALKGEVSSLKAQAAQNADNASKAQVDALDSKVAALEAKKETKNNMVFFRGGYARSDRKRDGVSIDSNTVGGGANVSPLNLVPGKNERADNDAWYFGAGMDFSFDDNLFGLMANTEVLGEVMFEYKEFNDTVKGNDLATDLVRNNGNDGAGGKPFLNAANIGPRDVTVSMFTLSASPKIKFMKGSAFRPWIIPAGFSMNVISPPSESITVLNPGVMFGAGADYNIWKNIYVGVDARYNWTPSRIDGVPTSGMTAGGYLGLGF
jgi:opacity protein-like surface antigen